MPRRGFIAKRDVIADPMYNSKLVTKLIARPGQIRRYFDEVPEIIEKVIEVARIHQKMGYNYE